MNPVKLIIFVLALSGSECHCGTSKEISDRDKSSEWLAESAVSTLLSCYEKEVNTVGGVGITEPKLHELLTTNQFQVILFSDNLSSKAVEHPKMNKGSTHKIQLFVIEAPSQPLQEIEGLLVRAVFSQYASITATYLIIDWPTQKNEIGCSNAYPYLWQAWKQTILNAFYVCLDKREEKMLVYSFNPYTSRAPAPWRLNETFKGVDDHPWSLFVREYHPGNRSICSNLNFVKTHDLGGYYFRCLLQMPGPSSEWTIQNVKQYYQRESMRYSRHILEALNATPDFYVYDSSPGESWSPRRNITVTDVEKILDMFIQFTNNQVTAGLPTSSHVIYAGLGVMTQYKGEMSQLDKLIGVLDRSTRIGLCLVAFKTLLFFKYFMRQPLGTAFLNVCRIVTNTGLLKVPKKSAPRLYLAGVFILVVTTVGIYQGLIASLLTKPTPLPDIDTMEDLMDSPHKIYMHNYLATHFTDQKFNGRLVLTNNFDCTEYVVRDPMAACVNSRLELVDVGIDLNLHVSRDEIVSMDLIYITQQHWNLKERVNEIITSFTESRIAWYLYERPVELKVKRAEYNKNLERDRPCKMKLSDLGFAFAILGIGWGLATVAFIVEVAMKQA